MEFNTFSTIGIQFSSIIFYVIKITVLIRTGYVWSLVLKIRVEESQLSAILQCQIRHGCKIRCDLFFSINSTEFSMAHFNNSCLHSSFKYCPPQILLCERETLKRPAIEMPVSAPFGRYIDMAPLTNSTVLVPNVLVQQSPLENLGKYKW